MRVAFEMPNVSQLASCGLHEQQILKQSKVNLTEGKCRLAFPSREIYLATGKPPGLSSSHLLRNSCRPAQNGHCKDWVMAQIFVTF